MARVLLIDDDEALREVLVFTIREHGHEVKALADGAGLAAEVEAGWPDVVITDLKMPSVDGKEVLRRVLAADAAIPVIVLTAFGTIEDAVQVMKDGAYHYLTKPCNREELRVTVDLALDRRRLLLENRALRGRLRQHVERDDLVYASDAMGHVDRLVRRIAGSDATVLITGESGTGKEVVARLLHSRSDRWDRPLVAVNCAAIPRDLLETELFGHARGAFTGATSEKPGRFQQARGGTLFLDEIGELAVELQSKLLRVIETRQVDVIGGRQPVPVDVRLVAATNADLEQRVEEGSFRGDLFYRLAVIPIHVPPLRARPDDIPALWDHFVHRFAGDAMVKTDPGLLRALMRRSWPGNVRELANTCQRAVLLRRSDVLTEEDVPATGPAPATDPAPPGGGTLTAVLGPLPADSLPLRELEREVISRALAKHGGNQTRTAAYLGVPRHVLLYRLRKFGIIGHDPEVADYSPSDGE